MDLPIKICIVAIFCSTIAFSSANSKEAKGDSDLKTFLLTHAIDPESHPKYRSWTREDWLVFLKQRDDLNRKFCSDCDSLLGNEMNTIVVASDNEIIDAFSHKNHDLKKSRESYSRKPFQAYTLIDETAFDCGHQHVYAEVNERGLPTDLLGLSSTDNNVKELNSTEINSTIKCSLI